MIVVQRAQPLALLRHVGRPLALVLGWDVVVTALYVVFGSRWMEIPGLPLPLAGSALILFLGFRNTVAYNRWWEARTLWGSIVNSSRSFAREALMLLPAEAAAMAQALVYRQVAFGHALRCSLRQQKPPVELATLIADAEPVGRQRSPANAILTGSGRLLNEAASRGWIDSIRLCQLEATLKDLSNAQGGLERIKNTPLLRFYTDFPRLFVAGFCIILPIGVVGDLGYWTPLGSGVIGFIFLAMERIGTDLQDPFEDTVHDVPMTSITRGIEIDLRQMLGETTVPPAVTAVDEVLW